MDFSGFRGSSSAPSGSLAGGAIRRMGGGEAASAALRPQPRPLNSRSGSSLVPEGLPSRGVIEPLGSLAYLQHRSPFAFAPAFDLPLPAVSLPPRLAAYPLKKRLICGEGSQDAPVPSAIDAAAAQQLLTPFDAAGLLPSLINPLGYPRLLLDPPLPSSVPAVADSSGALSPQQQRHQQHHQHKRRLPSAESIRHCLERLHKDDLALVLETLPEIPETLSNSLRQRCLGHHATARGGASGAPADAGAAEGGSQQQRQGAGQLRHPSKPHLRVKRVLRVVPHPSASAVSLVNVGLDIPAAEAPTLGLPPSPHISQQQQQQPQQQQQQQQRAFSWALLVPSGGSGAEQMTYALYLRDAQREATEAAAPATTRGEAASAEPLCSYNFRRDYVWQPPVQAAAAGGAERAVILVIPPAASAGKEEGPPPEEEECQMLPLVGPRRVLLKAGACKRRARLVSFVRGKERESREERSLRPADKRAEDTNDKEDGKGGPCASDTSLRRKPTPNSRQQGPAFMSPAAAAAAVSVCVNAYKDKEGPQDARGPEEKEEEEARQLFTEETPPDEDEEDASSGSGSSSSSGGETSPEEE